ncbi:DNA-3-methyladenine glycosylase II, partial [Achromobacter xylosoxidans C54]
FPAPRALLDTDPQVQRACGFSASKLATIRGIAQAALDGLIPARDEALAMSDEALVERLVTLRGVGRWTVEMLLIYTLERMDILPVDDFGVREGYRRLKRLDKAPSPAQMRAIGEAFSPYRTIAAWYLWRMPAPRRRRRHERAPVAAALRLGPYPAAAGRGGLGAAARAVQRRPGGCHGARLRRCAGHAKRCGRRHMALA